MLFEDLKSLAKNTTLITDAVSILRGAGYFGGAIDLAVRQASIFFPDDMAARAAFIQGAHQALHDLHHFKDSYITEDTNQQKAHADYGAARRLVSENILTKEEADVARSQLSKFVG